jgi:hypothetical protein
MAQALQVIDELEAALKSTSTECHHRILKHVTELFLAGSGSMAEALHATAA